MYDVSEAFLAEVRQSGKRRTVVDLYYGNNTDPLITDLPVIEGSITYDRNSAVRAQGQITIGDPDLLPTLEPYGLELVIRSGVVFPNGQEELVPMGTFLIDTESFEESEGRLPKLDFYDRTHRVSEVTLANGIGSYSGMRVGDALNRLVLQMAPGYTSTPSAPLWSLTFDDSLNQSQRLPGGFFNGEINRWSVIEDLADLLGAEVFFDRTGNALCQPVPTITSSTTAAESVWTIDADQGDSTGVMVKGSKKISRENAYNGVIVRGASPKKASEASEQVIGVAYDMDPNSRTYWFGPFGQKRFDTSNQALTTKKQCVAAAGKLLKKFVGLSRNATFTSLCNPALDVGDIITYQDLLGVEELFMVESLQMSFSSGEMTGQLSSRQYAGA